MTSAQSISPAFEGLTLADLAGLVYTFGATGMDMPDFKAAIEDEYASRCMMIYGRWKRAERTAAIAADTAPASIPQPTPTPTHTAHTPTQPTQPTPHAEIPLPPPPME